MLQIFILIKRKVLLRNQVLHRRDRGIKLVLDGYLCNVSLKNLEIVRDNDIVLAGLHIHIWNVLEPLNVWILGTLKDKLKKMLTKRTYFVYTIDIQNIIFTIFEILCERHKKCVIAKFLLKDYEKGLWNKEKKTVALNQYDRKVKSSTFRHECLLAFYTTPSLHFIVNYSRYFKPRTENHWQFSNWFKKRQEESASDDVIV